MMNEDNQQQVIETGQEVRDAWNALAAVLIKQHKLLVRIGVEQEIQLSAGEDRFVLLAIARNTEQEAFSVFRKAVWIRSALEQETVND